MDPEAIGLSSARLQDAYRVLDDAVQSGPDAGAVLLVGRRGQFLEPYALGRAQPLEDAPAVTPASVFLVASITKPVTATAVMLLVEAGRLALDQRVVDFIPEFGVRGKAQVSIWHLLTHTSGLPDMLPQNVRLRELHAGMEQFIAGICDCDLLFPPGREVRYQSCGFAILGEIVERVSGMRLRDFVQQRLFAPLRMLRTALGLRDDLAPDLTDVALPDNQVGTDWHLNSAYWRQLGAPWGGMFSTAGDLALFLQMFLDGGRANDHIILSPATVEAMTGDQLTGRIGLAPSAPQQSSWGLGWELRGRLFGNLASPRTFGHGGATGTMAWADPVRGVVCVLLTNQPRLWKDDCYLMPRLSNSIAAACL